MEKLYAPLDKALVTEGQKGQAFSHRGMKAKVNTSADLFKSQQEAVREIYWGLKNGLKV